MILLTSLIYYITGGDIRVISTLLVVIVTWMIYKRLNALRVPGPRSLPIIGNLLQMDNQRPFLTLQKWYQQYGGMYKMQLPGSERLVISGYDELYEVLVSRGKDFAGRFSFWRMEYAFKCQGIIQYRNPDDKWRALRKLTHAHIKQYGDGLSKLEVLVNNISEKMFDKFEKKAGTALDPKKAIFKAGLRTMAFLLTGKDTTSKDKLFHKIREYETLAFQNLSQVGGWQLLLLDQFPWLRHILTKTFKKVHRVKVLDKEIWEDIKEIVEDRDHKEALGKMLKEAVKSPARLKASVDISITDFDAQRAALSIFIAGVATTSMTFYAMVNVLATHQEVQRKLHDEIDGLLKGEKRQVNLPDRVKLPYTRACVLEILRYSSVAVFGVTHRALVDSTVKGVRIPRDTSIITNLWALHHDENFWVSPYEFKPERFMTDSGELVPADHPNRKHILPFGSGPRVCLGEGLAQSRLFLWLANLSRRFIISPSDPNNPVDPDPRGHLFDGGLVRHPPYTVIFTARTK